MKHSKRSATCLTLSSCTVACSRRTWTVSCPEIPEQSMPDQQVSVSGAEGFPLPGTRP